MAAPAPAKIFDYLDSRAAGGNNSLYLWAQRLVQLLNRMKILALRDVDIADKPLQVVRVKADGSGFEVAPEELGLAGTDLTGKGGYTVKVKMDETGFELVP